MCAKLKCCLNYEVDNYMEAGRKLPSREIVLETQDSEYFFFKADILSGMVTYSTDKKIPANLETISAPRAKEIIELNKRGERPLSLLEDGKVKPSDKPIDLFENESVTRFDKSKKRVPKQANSRSEKDNRNNEQKRTPRNNNKQEKS